MRNFYRWVVNHPKLILSIFSVAFVICLIAQNFISVNYDMNDYLPPETASTVALDIMEEEYDGGIPNARVLLKDVTVSEALSYKDTIEAIDGVTDVTWLDDVYDPEVPLESMDAATVADYYKDGNALLSVAIEEEKRLSAVTEIRSVIGEDNAMTGSAVSAAVATESTVSEIQKIAIFAVLFVFFVLMITTESYMEPVVVMVGLGVAIVINAGSNLIFGEISFVTNAAGNILQLAVSLDYSVFLIHRFSELRSDFEDPKDAMVEALTLSTSSILSSGLTTVIGFLALCLMQFQIGPDLGLALAKGIALSLITVFLFMPVFILWTYRLLDKTVHRPFLPSFDKFGRVVYRIMVPIAVLLITIAAPAYLASNANDFYYGSSHIFGTETQLGADTEEIEKIFGESDTYVLLVPKDDLVQQKALSDALHEIPEVSSIISYVDTVGMEIPTSYLDAETLSQLNSENYTRMVLSVDVAYEGSETFALVEKIRAVAEEYYPGAWYLAGEGVSTYDLMDTITADMTSVNLIAIGAVFVVLIFALKSLVLPAVLVLSIESAIWINMAIPYFADSTIFYIAYLIISSIQLGATVDYAILFTERYKECRTTMSKKDSIIATVSACTPSILTSGSVMTVVGFLLGGISTHGILSQLGTFLGKGTLCSMVIVLFALPCYLYLVDIFVVWGFRREEKRAAKKAMRGKVQGIAQDAIGE